VSDPTDFEALQRELANTQRKLREAEARLEVVERTGSIGLWSADMATGEGTWSATMYELYRREPALGPPAFQAYNAFVHPDDHDTLVASMAAMLQQPPGATPPIRFRTHPDLGPVRHLETCATVVDTAGGPLATGAVVDVTEREGARHQAAISTRRLRQILERMPFVVFGLDRDCRITFSNQRVSDTDVVGMDYRQFTSEQSRPALDAAIARAWDTGEVQLIRAQDRRGRWWEARYVGVRNEAGDIDELLGITLDITEQRELELRVEEAQKVESLGVLAGGIAHDFNNLLVGIIGNTDLAIGALGARSAARENLESVLQASQRAADLCRQMLAYSGRGHFVLAVVDPRAVVRDIAHLLRASISKRSVLRFDFDADTRPIEADVSQLRQVAMNLITNASDALGGQDGVITISSGTTRIDEATLDRAILRGPGAVPGLYTYIEVSDTGAGMDAATQARMFEPFFSSKGVGRGLGLAAVLGIVRGHAGSIDVQSRLGEGTTIRVLYPVADGAVTAPQALPTSADEARRAGVGTVLVVDDEHAVRTLARRTLERAGFEVVTAENGAEALEVFGEHHDKIVGVLLDLTMPVMGGAETFRRLRAIDPDVRVVLSSGYNEQEASEHFGQGRLVGFVQKPYRPRALRDLFVALADGG
jgi:PAS domain S-box-containing protein